MAVAPDVASQIKTLYSRQEYLTPGAPEAVDKLAALVAGHKSPLLLDVASGKGEAACALAQRTGSRVVAVDLYPLFFAHAASKIAHRGLAGRVSLLRADGKRLPLRDGAFDCAYCIGGPSIVGLDDCLRALARAVRPAGTVVVTDIVWRTKPGPLGAEWRWFASLRQVLQDEYAAAIEAAGLHVTEAALFPRVAWEVYHQPMRLVARDLRARHEDAQAARIEADIEMEDRAVDLYIDYAIFVAQRPATGWPVAA